MKNQNNSSFENAVIIGGSSSLGIEICNLFEKSSVNVISSYNKNLPKKNNPIKRNLHLDLSDEESIRNFADELKSDFNKIDILIFLPGILPGKQLKNYDFSTIDEVMTVNFNGQAKLLLKIFSLLTSSSRILLFSSISAQRGSFDPIYAASKGALLSFTKSMAYQLPKGARINSIAAGLIQDSKMFNQMSVNRQEHHKGQIPSGSLLLKHDLAKIIFDLSQNHWSHLNGACIDLNGGQYVR